MAFALMALSLISITSIQQDAFAQSRGMAISAIASEGSDTISVNGHTASQITDVTFRVTSPSGNNVVAVAQVTPDAKGDFAIELKISPMWVENGFYAIQAMQSIHTSPIYSLAVEVINGMAKETSTSESSLGVEYVGPKPAADKGLTIKEKTTKPETPMITIIGTTDSDNAITLKVIAPNGNVIVVDQFFRDPNEPDGHFVKEIKTGGAFCSQDGNYTIVAQQGDDPRYKSSIEVGIKDCVVIPEFGAIAAMILAVAIISIIAISAKSRLSIMPRY
jgi:predicted secreted protein with PEFG-CTERM motif